MIVVPLFLLNSQFCRYDPYSKSLTQEFYNHEVMRINRESAVQLASKENRFGLILGTLGRQGSTKVLKTIKVILCTFIHKTNFPKWQTDIYIMY